MFGVPGTNSKDGVQGAFNSVLNGGGAKASTEEAELEARKAASSKARKELNARRKDLLSDLKAFDEQLNKELVGLKKLLLAGDEELEIPQVPSRRRAAHPNPNLSLSRPHLASAD